MSADVELAVRARRAQFNKALADRDITGVSTVLARHVVMVTGTDSAVINGKSVQLSVWRREFSAKSPLLYVRTTESILSSDIEPIVMEFGKWVGINTSGDTVSSGVYSAKWRSVGDEWLLEAELFHTIR